MPISCRPSIESHTLMTIVSKSYQPTFDDFSKYEKNSFAKNRPPHPLTLKLATERVGLCNSAGVSGSGSLVSSLQYVNSRLFICASTTVGAVLVPSSVNIAFQSIFSRVYSLTSPISHKSSPVGGARGQMNFRRI